MPDARPRPQKLHFEMHDLQHRMGKPTIAALTGPARAAGVTLAVSCDCIVAADTASLGYPRERGRRVPGHALRPAAARSRTPST